MPESKSRKKSAKAAAAPAAAPSAPKPNPVWYKPVMFGLMIVGLLWIITYYITQGQFPIPALGASNILVGFGIAIVGFLMTTRWR
ncbi:cell division protein CrgA [Arthrobacter zhangbolii]|uniref:Cell division protein CrgA n=1 Tax=Arthrobacter zhangbolii TaxID=2886936 RepID=A0A9X1M809_9MICC|nr:MULTISPECIES: cell division protein CrgA [Arthrobacter]MCC3272014.1 cell division protein CrgA [Arthrobacter zhangbolii]MCC3294504.1 cell division protein CrgA [Arthrobacter zhangbolii]MDN3903073.1 cell division protein CrgA [Arthrobacter sp. YD2]UON92107.1 cell division protein CrgA [Arthrobacter zhangbolii]